MPRGVYERTPETNAINSRSKMGHSVSEETRALMSKTREESGSNDAMRGGNDICDHHTLYDHSDLSKNIIKMTRSMHMRLHNLFRKHGIEIPHININVK